jgi:predicted DNA-binding WGR domain protein
MVVITVSRYVYMEAVYPNINAYKFFELTMDGENITQRYGRIPEGYVGSGLIVPGGRKQPLKSSKYGNSPYSSTGNAEYAFSQMIYDKKNHKKTPYKVLVDTEDEKPRSVSRKSSRTLASMGVINHIKADGW